MSIFIRSISIADFQLAFRKLKSTVYYDSSNTNLFLRKKIAMWETDGDYIPDPSSHIDTKIKNLYVAFINRDTKFFDNLLSLIGYTFLPKKIQTRLADLPDNVLINTRTHSSYSFEKVTFFIDAPIELHIISVLWLMRYGYKLDKSFDKYCFGNRLYLNEDESGVINGLSLFKPYFVQYQNWRDKGIKKAQQLLEEKKDIIFINLDIQNYFYSIRLNIKQLYTDLKIPQNNSYGLNDLMVRICQKYSELMIDSKYPSPDLYKNFNSKKEILLPIGLLSSSVLANWYLNKFDNRIRDRLNPAYYSRYVDDIFIIIENPSIKSIDNNIQEFIISKYFKNILKKKIKTIKDKESTYYELFEYEKLVIQNDKVLLYYFDHKESTSVIDKLKRDLDERSSEFRFLPEYEDPKDFEKEAYELVYDDSLGKIRTLKDYKENRYGISTFLAKRIFAALRVKPGKDIIDLSDFTKFFRGENLLSFYTQWEKLFTYFIILDNKKEFIRLYTEINKLINSKLLIQYFSHLNGQLKTHLSEYLNISVDLALALNPLFLKSLNKTTGFNYKSELHLYRISNLIRDKYITHSLLNYTNIATTNINYSLIKHSVSLSNRNNVPAEPFGINDKFILYSPRKIKFYEATISTIRQCLSTKSKGKLIELNNPLALSEPDSNYLYKAFELYCNFNYPNISISEKKKKRNSFFKFKSGKRYNQFLIPNGGDRLSSIKISVANTKISQENIVASILNTPRETKLRYNTFSDLSKQTLKEKAQLFALPENFLPHDFLDLFARFSYQQQIALITGLEHWVINKVGYNFISTILPVSIDGANDAIVVLRLKNHYAPKEAEILRGYRIKIPDTKPKKYDLFIWRGLYFSNYYCYELCNISHRSIFKSKVDFLVSSEWNPDTNYFANIVESTARDVHCYFIQVNTPQYGDSRITCPKKTELKDILKLKGGDNHTILTGTLDIKALRDFQLKEYNLQQLDQSFKPTPPDFKRIYVRRRINNKPIIRK